MLKIKKTISKRIMSCFLIIAMMLTLLPAIPVYAEDSNSQLYASNDYSIEYTVNSSWGNSQSIRVKITNTGTEPILNWAVKFNAGGTISELSNAAVYKQTDHVYILKNVGYNYEIQPNQNVIFTYTVTGENLAIPDNIKLVSKRIEKQDGFDVQYSADNWGTGFQASVTITNNTDHPIEAWTLTFDGNFSVGNLWNARIISSNGNTYTVASQSWTNPIPANSTLSFSFTGTKKAGEEVFIDNFALTEIIISDQSERPDDGIIDQGDIEELISLGIIEVIRDEDGNFRVIDGTFTNQHVTSTSDAANVLNSASSLFGDSFYANASEITVQYLQDVDGTNAESVYRYNPLVNGIPVLGSQMVLMVDKNGIVQSLFSTYNNRINNVNTQPTITAQGAELAAINKLLTEETIAAFLQKVTESSGFDYDVVKDEFLSVLTVDSRLIIYDDTERITPVLAWEINLDTYANLSNARNDIISTKTEIPVLPFVSKTIYIYANGSTAGSILAARSNIQGSSVTLEANDLNNKSRTITAAEENGQYRLRDNGRNLETYNTAYKGFLWLIVELPGNMVEFTDVPSAEAVSAHANMAAAYDFYKNTLNRDSYDDDGAKLISSIDFDSNSWWGGKYYNAGWYPEIGQWVFGNEGNLEAALDVVGHEFTHAVIDTVSKDKNNPILKYEWESGALNESYADIMGCLIENKSDDFRWFMGEDSDAPFRNLEHPSQYGQPIHYQEYLRTTLDDDNGGVHTNSGIFNFAAYKMMADSRTSSVSTETWAKLFYRSLFRLTTNSKFLDARGAVISTAKSLGFNSTQLQAIKDAFDEVGIVEPNSIRIVLKWGAQPYDLDSHLVGPAVNGIGTFHIYYSQRNYYKDGSYSSPSELTAADLEYDVTSSYGPEITTIHRLTQGDYYFYVHDYTNRNKEQTTALANSQATVEVYRGSSAVPINSFRVDASSAGTLWSAFKLTVYPNGELSVAALEAYSYCSNPALVGN